MTFHHIGVATYNLEKSIAGYQQIGYTWQDELIFEDPIQRVRIAFMINGGHPIIELVAPLDETAPVNKILEKSKTTPYHTCYEVADIQAKIGEWRKLRFIPLSQPVPAIAFDQRLICFMYHPDMGLIELLQASI
jgi:methylmalonyl-CoA/ethylmalonyl-CoA epimerase